MKKKNPKSQLENNRERHTEHPQELPSWLILSQDGVILAIHAQPGAKRDAILGEYNNRLKLSLNSPPVDGKANSKLITFLAEKLGTTKNAIRFISGETQRTKRLAVIGIDAQAVIKALT